MSKNQGLLFQKQVFLLIYLGLAGKVAAFGTHATHQLHSSNHVFANDFLSLAEALEFTRLNQPDIQSKKI